MSDFIYVPLAATGHRFWTMVSLEDADIAYGMRWYRGRNGYVLNRSVYLHRRIGERMGNPKGLPIVHHLNGNPFDNRRCNLEWATQAVNMALARFRERSAGYRGVLPPEGRRKSYRARYRHSLEGFRDPALAALARDYMVADNRSYRSVLNFRMAHRPDLPVLFPKVEPPVLYHVKMLWGVLSGHVSPGSPPVELRIHPFVVLYAPSMSRPPLLKEVTVLYKSRYFNYRSHHRGNDVIRCLFEDKLRTAFCASTPPEFEPARKRTLRVALR